MHESGIYSFGSRLLGQHPICLIALAPDAQGFHKRYHLAVAPDNWMACADKESWPCQDAKNLIVKVHEYVAKAAENQQAKRVRLDGHALSAFRALGRALETWLGSNRCEEHFQAILSCINKPQSFHARYVYRLQSSFLNRSASLWPGQARVLQERPPSIVQLCSPHRPSTFAGLVWQTLKSPGSVFNCVSPITRNLCCRKKTPNGPCASRNSSWPCTPCGDNGICIVGWCEQQRPSPETRRHKTFAADPACH